MVLSRKYLGFRGGTDSSSLGLIDFFLDMYNLINTVNTTHSKLQKDFS